MLLLKDFWLRGNFVASGLHNVYIVRYTQLLYTAKLFIYNATMKIKQTTTTYNDNVIIDVIDTSTPYGMRLLKNYYITLELLKAHNGTYQFPEPLWQDTVAYLLPNDVIKIISGTSTCIYELEQ